MDGIKIINKNGIKLCLDCMPLPSFGQMGEIVERLNSSMNHSRMVLTANDPNEGSKVIYDPDIPWDEKFNITQGKTAFWSRSRKDENGYFFIQNDKSKQRLYGIENDMFTNGPLPNGM